MKPRRAPEALLGKQLAAVRRLIAPALQGDREAVHRLRVATRRLREALPVVAVADVDAPARKARRTARRMTRTLRTVRELDVCLQLLDELARTKAAPAPAVGRVRIELAARRTEEWRRILDDGRLDADRLGRRLDRTNAALATVAPGSWRANLGQRLSRRASVLERALDEAGKVYSPAPLHRVRLASKKLRYALEVATEFGVARNLADLQRRLKKAQETLGDLHDRAVLANRVRLVANDVQAKEPATAAALEALACALDDQCRRLHGKFVAAQPVVRDVAARASLLAERLTRPRRRVLKMRMAKAGDREKVG